jgi:hypothetical protein
MCRAMNNSSAQPLGVIITSSNTCGIRPSRGDGKSGPQVDHTRGVGIFARVGLADESTSATGQFYSAGVGARTWAPIVHTIAGHRLVLPEDE